MKLNLSFKDLCHFMNVSLLASFSSLFPVSITDRDKKISVTSFAKRPEKNTFIFASVIFLMLRHL